MTTTEASTRPFAHAERIGPYRILQVLGEGGMGIVYEAEETGAVRRRVALKVLKDRNASREVLARFEVEQQALAIMSHPGIAKVLSAGTTASGQPFFAMELVRGLPITRFCDEQRLGVRARLQLFIDVCHAVQHAHQKGLIHRDIKPSNILVADADGVPSPCVIDFGIAKAVGSQLTDTTLVTAFGAPLGTAAYMSPEQAEAGNLDVDTRADIYSLGVVLYELLVGRLPVDPSSVGIHVYLARLMARENPAPTPSARFGGEESDSQTVARARSTDPDHLRRALRGDLDWIVMKAMEADRNRRYQTVNAFGMDIHRHLANEPVTARPPSTSYRLVKFVRRNRTMTGAAALALLLVIASTVATTLGMLAAERATRQAAADAATARAVSDFLVEIFNTPSPGASWGASVTARQILDRGAHRAVTDLASQPTLQSRMLGTIGTVYGSLGLYPDATRLLEQALRTSEQELGPRDTLVARVLRQLGDVATRSGDLPTADRHLTRALAVQAATLPPADPSRRATMSSLALLRLRQGRFAEADTLYASAIAADRLALRQAAPSAAERASYARDLSGLANVRVLQERFPEATRLLLEAVRLKEQVFGPDHMEVAASLNSLGVAYWKQRRYRDALPIYLRTRRIFAQSLPEGHPVIASSLNNLGETYWKLGELGQARVLLDSALAIKERTLAPTNPDIATTLVALAGVYRDAGRYGEADPLYRRAIAIQGEVLGADHPITRATQAEVAAMGTTGRRPRGLREPDTR